MTVIGRRSAEVSRPLAGAGLGEEAGAFAEGVGPDRAAIAASSLRRSPTAETPMSLRSSAVSCGSTSASILFSRKLASYWSRPRPRSHPAKSMAALHMDIYRNRQAETCPAASQERSVSGERKRVLGRIDLFAAQSGNDRYFSEGDD